MALSEKAAQELAAKNELDPGLVKEALAAEISGEAKVEDILRVPYRIGTTLNRSMAHASRFFRELRDNGAFYASKCPECGHVLFPPIRPICLRCIKKGKLVDYEPFKLGDEIEGTVVSWSKLVRGTSKHIGRGVVYPAIIKVDGADNAVWQYVMPTEGAEISVGARVRAIRLDQEERTGEMNDFAFKLI